MLLSLSLSSPCRSCSSSFFSMEFPRGLFQVGITVHWIPSSCKCVRDIYETRAIDDALIAFCRAFFARELLWFVLHSTIGPMTSPAQKIPYHSQCRGCPGGRFLSKPYVGIEQAYQGSFGWVGVRAGIPGYYKVMFICLFTIFCLKKRERATARKKNNWQEDLSSHQGKK